MRAALAAVMVVSLGIVAATGSQARPNLSGTWAASTDAVDGLTPAPAPTLGARFTIEHDGDRFTVVRPVRDTTMSATFTLGGPEVRTRIPPRLCDGEAETIEIAAWDGQAIAFTVVGSIPAGGTTRTASNVKRVFRLQSADALIVEATIATQGGGAPRQVATLYRRSTDVLSAAAPAPMPAVKTAPATIANAAWIAGTWIGTNGATTVEERWTPAASGSMIAVARTLRNSTMSAFEFLCIVERGGSLAYTAMPNGRMPPTYFALTAISADSATFENPAHDYPKIIRYTKRPDGSLETTISAAGGQRAQSVVLKAQ